MKSLTLSIPKPCHANWSTMTPTQRGAFCISCQREVIDFTTWTDQKIIEYFSKGRGACGRIRQDQLKEYKILREKNRVTKWWTGLMIMVGILMIKPSMGQARKTPETEQVDIDTTKYINKLDQLRNWSSSRTRSDAIGERKPTLPRVPDIADLLSGTVGGVVAEISQPPRWYQTVYDWLR